MYIEPLFTGIRIDRFRSLQYKEVCRASSHFSSLSMFSPQPQYYMLYAIKSWVQGKCTKDFQEQYWHRRWRFRTQPASKPPLSCPMVCSFVLIDRWTLFNTLAQGISCSLPSSNKYNSISRIEYRYWRHTSPFSMLLYSTSGSMIVSSLTRPPRLFYTAHNKN